MTRHLHAPIHALATGMIAAAIAFHPMVSPAQVYPGWPVPGGVPPPPAGSTPGGSLRNAVSAVHNQVGLARNAARYWSRQVGSAGYPPQNTVMDFQGTVYAFQGVRQQFNWAASLAAQQPRPGPGAANAVAELSSGLDIIAELFGPVQAQLNAGVFDRDAIVRMCRALDDALGVWDRELTRNSARLNLAW